MSIHLGDLCELDGLLGDVFLKSESSTKNEKCQRAVLVGCLRTARRVLTILMGLWDVVVIA
jgi:hypothetical protein